MTTQESLEVLAAKNRLKRQVERSKDTRERRQSKEREQNFDVHFSGANQERQKQKQMQHMQNRLNSRSNSRGARRQWLASDQTIKPQAQNISADSQKYKNPFELAMSGENGQQAQQQPNSFANAARNRPANLPTGKRKQWDTPSQQLEIPQHDAAVQGFMLPQDEENPDLGAQMVSDEEEIYEEDFDEDDLNSPKNNDIQTEIKQEALNSSEKEDVEHLLLTATQEQFEMLKKSINNMGNIGMPSGRRVHDESSYIEDEIQDDVNSLEEDIPETVVEEDSYEEDQSQKLMEEQYQLEKRRQEEIRQANTRKAKTRPISATYDLKKVTSTQMQKKDSTNTQSAVVLAMQAENRSLAVRGASARNPVVPGGTYQGYPMNQNDKQYASTSQIKFTSPQINTQGYKNLQFQQQNFEPKSHRNLHENENQTLPVTKIPPSSTIPVQNTISGQKAQPTLNSNLIPMKATNFYDPSQTSDTMMFERTENQNLASINPKQQQSAGDEVSTLLNKIYNLEDNKRKQLITLLKGLDNQGTLGQGSNELNYALEKFISPKTKQVKQPTNQNQPLAQNQRSNQFTIKPKASIKIPSTSPRKQNAPISVKSQRQDSGPSTVNRKAALKSSLMQPSPSRSNAQASPTKAQVPFKDKVRTRNELIIRVLSTYGHPHVCGLTEIELIDVNAKKIPLIPSCLMARNLGKGQKVQLDRLINNQITTNNDRNMWFGYLPRPPNNLEIQIFYPKDAEIAGVRLWNYNKSILDCTKCAKRVQIFCNDEKRWEGDLLVGKGQYSSDYSTKIIVAKDKTNLKSEVLFPSFDSLFPTEASSNRGSILSVQSSVKGSQPQNKSTLNLAPIDSKIQKNDGPKNIGQMSEKGMSKYQSEAIINLHSVMNREEDEKAKEALDPDKPIWLANPAQNFRGLVPSGSTLNVQHGAKSNRRISAAAEELEKSMNPSPSKQSPSKRPSKYRGELADIPEQIKDQVAGRRKSNKERFASGSKDRQSAERAVDAVRSAVNSVNKVLDSSAKKQALVANGRGNANRNFPSKVTVEESLNSLDYFKVTNLGRMKSKEEEEDSVNIYMKQSLPQQVQLQNEKSRAKWEVQNSVGQTSTTSLSQTSTRKSGLQIPSKGLPEDFLLPSPARNNRQNRAEPMRQSLSSTKPPIPNPAMRLSLNSELEEDSLCMEIPSISKSLVEEQLIIPTLPFGQKLKINILNTWGDMNYTGLAGIEFFDVQGKSIPIDIGNVTAHPPDVNILPGYGSDPRTVDKLVDGHYCTEDDLHVWLTPFTQGEEHTIDIDFGEKKYLSMIRIWNYNKSRIHSFRGAKDIECRLDGKLIFRGEIRKAPGNTKDAEQCCEIILFTDNESIMEKIDESDWLNEYQQLVTGFEDTQKISETWNDSPNEERPLTATKKFTQNEVDELAELQFQIEQQQKKPTSLFDERPQTSALIPNPAMRLGGSSNLPALKEEDEDEFPQQVTIKSEPTKDWETKKEPCIKGRVIWMNILESWGDLFYVGLNGIEVIDSNGQIIPINMDSRKVKVTAVPRDMNSIQGHGQDHRTLEKLFNGTNDTIDDKNMWLIPFNKDESHTIEIDFGQTMSIHGIRFYNYNKSIEDSLRGTRQIVIKVDGQLVTPRKGVTLRKAPGCKQEGISMGQLIKIPFTQGWSTEAMMPLQNTISQLQVQQEYEPISIPIGFNFKFKFFSTHGDPYYIGLNGIELFDQNGKDVLSQMMNNQVGSSNPDPEMKIHAVPSGVNTIKGMETDVRTVQKLFNGCNRTEADTNMWLAPFKNTHSHSAASAVKDRDEKREPNFVNIILNQPIAISGVRIWNYAKTPERGVHEFELEIDGNQVFRGYLKQFSKEANQRASVVLFTGRGPVLEYANQVHFDSAKTQNVQMINEGRVLTKNYKAPSNTDQVSEQNRPVTQAIKTF